MRAGSTIHCPSCGSATASGAEFCRRCGNDLTSPGLIPAISAREDTAERTIVLDSYAPADVAASGRQRRRPRRRRRIGLAVLFGLLVGSGAGYGAYLGFYADAGAGQRTAAQGHTGPAVTASPSAGPAMTGTLPPTITAADPSGSGSDPSGGNNSGTSDGPLVAAAPALSGQPETREVVDLLTAYFGAINAKDFEAAHRTLVQRDGLPTNATEFRNEYRSTRDADVRLLNLSSRDDGSLLALVSFTSYQDAVDAPDKSSTCLVWSMAYPLVRDDQGKLLIDVIGRSSVTYQSC